jgi:hypothetical protein
MLGNVIVGHEYLRKIDSPQLLICSIIVDKAVDRKISPVEFG